ncbi:hypothetical protein ACSDQ9_01565 [Aestuariimicrobium soli]|uniref:hypothetical protein n=1 Tax=Aestuariimicrobium soli TaxID=2035834 RepID=UPI003EBE836B
MTWPLWVLVAVGLVWLVAEGWTILVCLRAGSRAGGDRLNRLGFRFLATEAWTLLLLGATHGIVPDAVHRLGDALLLFVAAWMVRDLGLWLGPRTRRQELWRRVIGGAAIVQLLVIAAVAFSVIFLRWTWPSSDPSASAGLLAGMVVPVAIVGVALQVWLLRLQRARGLATGSTQLGWDA